MDVESCWSAPLRLDEARMRRVWTRTRLVEIGADAGFDSVGGGAPLQRFTHSCPITSSMTHIAAKHPNTTLALLQYPSWHNPLRVAENAQCWYAERRAFASGVRRGWPA